MRLIALLLVLLASCATTAPPSTVLDCRALTCPSEEDAADAVRIFATITPLDRTDPIIIEWHAEGETFGSWTDDRGTHQILGLTVSRNRVRISSWALLAHELMHLALWRAAGSPDDARHEEPPGPWTAESTQDVDRVTEAFHQAFGEPP